MTAFIAGIIRYSREKESKVVCFISLLCSNRKKKKVKCIINIWSTVCFPLIMKLLNSTTICAFVAIVKMIFFINILRFKLHHLKFFMLLPFKMVAPIRHYILSLLRECVVVFRQRQSPNKIWRACVHVSDSSDMASVLLFTPVTRWRGIKSSKVHTRRKSWWMNWSMEDFHPGDWLWVQRETKSQCWFFFFKTSYFQFSVAASLDLDNKAACLGLGDRHGLGANSIVGYWPLGAHSIYQ